MNQSVDAAADTDPRQVALLAQVDTALSDFISNCDGAKGVLVATDDGYVVSARPDNPREMRTVAAMTASVMGLGESMSKQLQQEPCLNVTIESEAGFTVCLRVAQTFVLCAMTDQSIRLGMLLSSAKICAQKLDPLMADLLSLEE